MSIVLFGLFVFPFEGVSGNELLICKRGDLPIILTAPHGGVEPIPGAKLRSSGVIVRDEGTLELCEAVGKRLFEKHGRNPFIVAARFSRKFLDVNRPESRAFVSLEAEPVYRAYHRCIADFVSDIRRAFPEGGLLLDIHGQSRSQDGIYRGTANGRTVKRLLERHGQHALTGKKSILGMLESMGYRVLPPCSAPGELEHEGYTGGYTVQTYGSHRPNGIDAIQLEIGNTLRSSSVFAEDLTDAIMTFCRTYIIGNR